MKKLLGIVVLSFLLSGNAKATIYSCNINGVDAMDHEFSMDLVINVNNNSKQKLLLSTDWDRLVYSDKDIILANSTNQKIGSLIVTNTSSSMIRKASYNLFVSRNYKSGDGFYFVGIFNASDGFISTITISPFDMKIFVYLSEYPELVFDGNCK